MPGRRVRRAIVVAAVAALVPVVGLDAPAGATPVVHLISSGEWGPGPIGEVHVVGEVQNTGSTDVNFVQIFIDELDAHGNLIGSDQTTTAVDMLAPGEKSSFDDTIAFLPPGFNHAAISGVSALDSPTPPNHAFTTTVTNRFVDPLGQQHIVGTVKNDNSTTAQFVEVDFTFYNAAGATVDSDFTMVNTNATSDLGSGATASFELVRYGRPAYASFVTLTQSTTDATGAPPPPGPTKAVTRVSGADRVATSIEASKATFPTAGAAGAAVLANFTSYADALPGVPLAVAKHGPLLLTPGDSLDARVGAELQRVLPAGATVYLLGGNAVMTPALAGQVRQLGFTPVRYGGANRFATAAMIADLGLGDPAVVFEATGLNFPDALAGGAVAAHMNGAVLLTDGPAQAPETSAYLAAHPPTTRYALGAPAAAADPAATAIAGADRFETATLAAALVPAPSVVGVASGTTFADALSGGATIAAAGGPMVLVPSTGPLPASVQSYLSSNSASIQSALVFGGAAAVGGDVVQEVAAAIS